MLEYLHLKNVGPAPEMRMDLGSRLNLITGDNGLGKSFLLDVMWWALTRRWPFELNRKMTSGYVAQPRDSQKAASIAFQLDSNSSHRGLQEHLLAQGRSLDRQGRPAVEPRPGDLRPRRWFVLGMGSRAQLLEAQGQRRRARAVTAWSAEPIFDPAQ